MHIEKSYKYYFLNLVAQNDKSSSTTATGYQLDLQYPLNSKSNNQHWQTIKTIQNPILNFRLLRMFWFVSDFPICCNENLVKSWRKLVAKTFKRTYINKSTQAHSEKVLENCEIANFAPWKYGIDFRTTNSI